MARPSWAAGALGQRTEFTLGARELRLLQAKTGQVEVRIAGAGVDVDRLHEGLFGAPGVTGALEIGPEAVQRAGIVGATAQNGAVRCGGSRVVAQTCIGGSEIVERDR